MVSNVSIFVPSLGFAGLGVLLLTAVLRIVGSACVKHGRKTLGYEKFDHLFATGMNGKHTRLAWLARCEAEPSAP